MRALWLLFLFSFSYAQVQIESGITHGGEIEFTSDFIIAADSAQKIGKLRGREWPAARKLAKVVGQKCRYLNCQVQAVNGKWGKEFRVQLQNGWWFQISYDPLCVEIQTKPSTLQELYLVHDIAHDLIFNSAIEAGLEVRPSRATHMNTGARSAFGYDIRSLFNYFVDNASHPEFASGVFRKNWNTAPPLIISNPTAMESIQAIQEKIESGKIKSFAQLAKEISKKLHAHVVNVQFNPKRNQDLSFRKLITLTSQLPDPDINEIDMPFERRGVRAVRSFLEFILHAEIIESRISWVKNQPGFIPFVRKEGNELSTRGKNDFFKQWLIETGLSADRYGTLIQETPLNKKSLNACLNFYVYAKN